MAVGLEKKGGGRKEGLGFCTVQAYHRRFETQTVGDAAYHRRFVLQTGSCYKPAVICSQDITNGS